MSDVSRDVVFDRTGWRWRYPPPTAAEPGGLTPTTLEATEILMPATSSISVAEPGEWTSVVPVPNQAVSDEAATGCWPRTDGASVEAAPINGSASALGRGDAGVGNAAGSAAQAGAAASGPGTLGWRSGGQTSTVNFFSGSVPGSDRTTRRRDLERAAPSVEADPCPEPSMAPLGGFSDPSDASHIDAAFLDTGRAPAEQRGSTIDPARPGRRVRWLNRDVERVGRDMERAGPNLPVQVAGTLTGLPVSSTIGREVARMLGVLAPTIATGAGVVLHVTSAVPSAGVSTVARELAATANILPACRPLLLSAKPGDAALEPGLGTALPDLLAAYRAKGTIAVMDVQTVRSSFHAAHVVTEPRTTLLDPESAVRPIGDLWAGLHRTYNLIVVDCMPIPGLLGFLPITNRPPQVVLVVTAGVTRAGAAVRARVLIERMGGQLVGAVMNHN